MPADGAAPAAIVVKADVLGWLSSHCRRVTFADRSQLDRDSLHRKLATAFALQPDSFRLAYRDDDNDLIELATPADLAESLDFFSFGSSNASASTSSQHKRAGTVTMRLKILVDYDGPALSEAGTGLGSGLGGGGFSSVAPSRTGPLSVISRAETTISAAATDREGALARWKAEQDALAFQFARVAVRPAPVSADREEVRHLAAQERENRRAQRNLQRDERERMERQRERNLGAMERNRERRVLHELRQQDSGPTTPNATVPFLSSLHDGPSGDEWIRERAFDRSHGVTADEDAKSDFTTSSVDGQSLANEQAGQGAPNPADVSGDDDDDWDRETVSSFLPFGGAAARQLAIQNGGPSDAHPLVGYSRAGRIDVRELDHLHPNFASHFIATEHEIEQYLPPGAATPDATGYPVDAGLSNGSGRLPFRSYHPHQRPQPRYDGFSPMFSSPSESSMHSYAPDSQYGAIDGESTYRPTGSERARVDALFAPSDYASTSDGAGAGVSNVDAMSTAASAQLDPNSRSGDRDSTPDASNSTMTTAATTMTLVQEASPSSDDFSCAVCSDAITGIRFMCIQCEGYNMCEVCEDDPGAKLAERKKRSASFSSRMRNRRADEYIPMLHDPNHVLLKIRPGATVPPSLGLLAGRPASASPAASVSTAPAPPPPPPVSTSSTPLPYLGRTKHIPIRMPSDGPTRLTRPDRDAVARSEPQELPLVPAFSIPEMPLFPAFSLPAISFPSVGVTIPAVEIPAVSIPKVHIPPVPLHIRPPAPIPVIPAANSQAAAAGSSLLPYAVQPPSFRRFDSVLERNHGVNCSECGELIPTGHGEDGVRYLCGNCPTVPGYSLCAKCERDSARIHDPTHAFLRLTHRLQRPLPSLSSGLVPLLYLPPTPKSESDDTQSEKTDVAEASSMVTKRPDRDRVVCDACGKLILEEWMMCCHCPVSFDLCRTCLVERNASDLARHNPSHVFLQLKEKVDLELLKQVTRFTSRRPRGLIEWDLYA